MEVAVAAQAQIFAKARGIVGGVLGEAEFQKQTQIDFTISISIQFKEQTDLNAAAVDPM